MPQRVRMILPWLLPLALALTACGAKRSVRMPSYWPESRAELAQTPTDKSPTASGKDSPRKPAGKDELEGVASWYGEDYHGRKTADGETYNMDAMTAAHKTLPFDTRVKVTNVESNKEIVVRINDRGPFVDGRIIDLSRAAAKKLDLYTRGIGQVRLEPMAAHALPSSDSAKYTVQVGYFGDRRHAVLLVGKLKSHYQDVSVEPVAASGFRVQVGLVDTRAEAVRLLEKLRNENLSGFVRMLE